MKHWIYSLLVFLLVGAPLSSAWAQLPPAEALPDPVLDYSSPTEYEIGGLRVEGNEYSDENAIIAVTGLAIGKRVSVPGPKIPKAINSLWNLKLFTDVQIVAERQIGEVLFLVIKVKERPRLTRWSYVGARKNRHDELNAKLRRHLSKGGIVTESVKINSINAIKAYYAERGFLDAAVTIQEVPDSLFVNSVRLVYGIDKKKRVKIKEIDFYGNEQVSSRKLRKQMKETKRKKRWFNVSKFQRNEYKTDKENIINYYNRLGYRDAQILRDSVYRVGRHLGIDVEVKEGSQYYFRDIVWKGNTIYSTDRLATRLGIGKGDVYNRELLDTRLEFSPDGLDVSSLYLDNGYLFLRIDAVETAVFGDSIDVEIRVNEGPQATIDKVLIAGNDRTHEHVIRRELRTKPGQKFSRSDIIRSQRQIMGLGFFNPETMQINTPVNPARGTVDVEYIVEEKPSDQLELSAGWGGAGRGIIGTLGVTFNNFSLRNIGKPETWSPLPQGDGQRLSIRAQTNGKLFQSYNFSLTEPWLGGKKPNSFTVAGFYSRYTNGADKESSSFATLKISGVSAGLGTRLKWPDDYFVSNTTVGYQRINLQQWSGFRLDDGSPVASGDFNNLSITQTLSRNSVDNPIFPKSGSRFTVSLQATPPYSLFQKNRDFASEEPEQRFKMLEYHKWRFTGEWFTPLFGKFVLRTSAKIGMLGYYNNDIGITPFERFELGGDGISNQGGIEGRTVLALRGYDVGDLSANTRGGASVFDKFTLEVRYPFSLNPNATVYALAFLEGGNAWDRFRDFNPLELRRSAGAGIRIFLPMFGTLGFDYGFGFDKDLPASSKATDYARFSIILGFEPE